MTVLSGEVRTTISMRGTGDGAAKVDGWRKSVDGLEGSVGKTRKGFGALGTSLQQVAGVASPALGALARDIGDVSGLVGEVAGKFGFWGTVVAGVVTGIGALVAVLVSSEPALSTYGQAMETAAKRSSDMATAITTIAGEARVAQGSLDALSKTAMNAFASLQELRGDKEGAALTRSKAGAVEASGEAAKAESDFALTAARLATADAIRKQAIDDITYAERDLLEAQLRHDESAAALAAVRLSNSRFAKAEAESAVRDLTPLVQRMATTAGALRGLATEQQLQADMVDGVGFFQLDAETQKYVNKGGAPGEDPWDEADTAWEAKRQRFGPGGGRGGALTRGGFAALERQIGDATGRDAEAERVRDLTSGIRDFTSALEGAVPSTSAFAGALEQVRSIWEAWGQGAQTTRQAVIGSLGAIAMASAQGIKGERERAGVLGAIYMGLGIAHVVTPGMQVQGAGEIAGGAMLIAAALTTPSSGSRGRGGGRGSGPVRAMGGETMGGGAPMVVNINAPWFGPSPQEAMAGLGGMLRATAGTGWEAGR